MKKIFCLSLFLVLFCITSVSFARDINSECGVYQERAQEIYRELQDTKQFKSDNEAEMRNFRSGKLSPSERQRYNELRAENGRLQGNINRLQEEYRRATQSYSQCVERYKSRRK